MPKRKYTRRTPSTWPFVALPSQLASALPTPSSPDVRLSLPSGLVVQVSLTQLGQALDVLRERGLC
jgi:hypothetical protein